MIQNKQVFDAVPDWMIRDCIDDYDSKQKRWPGSMNTADPGIHVGKITKMVSELIGKKAEYRSGNYYQHDKPYLPHTDWFAHIDNNLNVVIPLRFDCEEGLEPSLVVFDQVWPYNGVTWCMHYPVLEFNPNTGVKGCPGEYPVKNKTDKPFDVDLYRNYLSQYPYSMLKNLSGKVYPFTPGSLIIFNNRNVHCTSYYKGVKLGLSLRFKV